MASSFYVTTPIYSVDDVPQLDRAYTTIAADVLARYRRLRGYACRFLTGTDEHGRKVQREAEARGLSPERYADEVAGVFRETWPKLGCQPDDFIRSTEERHKRWARALWSSIESNGDIYEGYCVGLYCVCCEAFYAERDLKQPGNLCPLHGQAAESVKEKSYFFRLSRYQYKLLEHYKRNPGFMRPEGRQREVVSLVQKGLGDLPISRVNLTWGVRVPTDPEHVMYVWFEALANYISALYAPDDNSHHWPASVHVVGKDILRFHAVYWPAFLMSAGYELPEQIFAHGALTCGGQKIVKSSRGGVDPVALATSVSEAVGVDALRYCLMRAIPFGDDGDFRVEEMLERYGAELCRSLGSLLERTLSFAREVPAKGANGPLEEKLFAAYEAGAMAAAAGFDETNPTGALTAIWDVLKAANEYLDRSAPAEAKDGDPERLGTIVGTLIELLEGVSVMVAPVMPKVAASMREQLGLSPLVIKTGFDQWPFALPRRAASAPLRPGAPLFPRLEPEKAEEIIARFASPSPADGSTTPPPPTTRSPEPVTRASLLRSRKVEPRKPEISYDDFAKLDLKIGVVVTAERANKNDQLLVMRVDVGEGTPRQIVSGIGGFYDPEEAEGKRVVVLCNTAPRDFGNGLVSDGMLLAAVDERGLRVLTVDGGESAAGSKVR